VKLRVVAASILGVVALVAVGYALRPSSDGAAAAPTPALGTPLWSIRRVPAPVAALAGDQRLRADTITALEGYEACLIVESGSGSLVDQNGTTALTPASTTKLLTAVAALSVLGPETRFTTRAAFSAAPVDGTVDRIVLVGGGDPLLATPEYASYVAQAPLTAATPTTTSLAALADSVVGAGITSVPGGIGFDDSRHEATRLLPGWKPTDLGESVGPPGALEVNGGLTDWWGDVAADDPGAYTTDEFARLLGERGVAVGPGRGRAAPPGGNQGATVQSAPVSEIVAEMLSASDNLTAEVLTREVGLKASGAGTTAAGVAEIRRVLATLNVPTGGLVLNDGSGLSRDNRISCATLNAALNLTTLSEFASIRDGLAVAGERGTLIGRFVGTPVRGHLVAKTGSLDRASALAGFLDVGTPLQFALIANGNFSGGAANGVRERVVDVLARYPDVPPLERLVPPPEPR